MSLHSSSLMKPDAAIEPFAKPVEASFAGAQVSAAPPRIAREPSHSTVGEGYLLTGKFLTP